MRIIDLTVDEKDNGREIRDILREFGVSSALLKKLKMTENGITKNGNFAKSIETVKTSDIIEIKITDTPNPPTMTDLNVEVLYEDEDLIAVNKPPYMPVHESRNHQGDTLANAVSYYLNGAITYRSIFRLDRDTGGIVLIAKNEFAASKLAGKVRKDYYAVVNGIITNGGTIDENIGRKTTSIIERAVMSNGQRAITHYEPIRNNGKFTLVKIRLETGRTHQIRVHFAHMGYPLVGDSLYGEPSPLIGRQALQCKEIRFIHPVSNEHIKVSSELPLDFKGLI